MNFNFDNVLNEGGKAIKTSEPIRGDLSLPVANQVINLLREKYNNLQTALLGSTGKKGSNQTCGDIDIAVQLDYSESNNVLEFIKSKFPNIESNFLNGFKILSIGYPYTDYEKEQKIVQVDLMFFPNIELAKYFYYSPDYTKNQSQFKGSVRNLLMMAILKNIDVQDNPNTTFDNGHIKDLWKYTIKPESGLVLVHQSFEGKKGQEIKSKHTIKEDTKIVNQNPQQITKFMMGSKASDDTISSFEKMVQWMMTDSFPYKNKNEQIFKDFDDYIDHQIPELKQSVDSYIKSCQNGNNEGFRRSIRLLGDVINESVFNKVKKTNNREIEKTVDNTFCPSRKELFEELKRIAVEVGGFWEDFFEDDSVCNMETFLTLEMTEREIGFYICLDIEVNNNIKNFGIEFLIFNPTTEENEYYYFEFNLPSKEYNYQTYQYIVKVFETMMHHVGEDSYDAGDLRSMASTLDDLEVTQYLTPKSKEDYQWSTQQKPYYNDEDDDEEMNESVFNKVKKVNRQSLEDGIDSMFDYEDILRKFMLNNAIGGIENDETYHYLWLPLPSSKEITEDDTFCIDGQYPTCLLISEVNDGGEFDTSELLVRFAEDNDFADIGPEGDEYFSDLSSEQKQKIVRLVEISTGMSFEQIVKTADNISESVFNKVKKVNKQNVENGIDEQIFKMTPEEFRDEVIKRVLEPLGLEYGEYYDEEEGDYYWQDRPAFFEHQKILTIKIDRDYDENYPLILRFCNYDGKYEDGRERDEYGVNLCLDVPDDYLFFALTKEGTVFREMGGLYNYYYRINLESLDNVCKVIQTIQITKPWLDVTVENTQGNYQYTDFYNLPANEEDTLKIMVKNDIFNLSKLQPWMEKNFSERYNEILNSLDEDEYEEYDEDYETEIEDEEYK